MPVHTEGPAPYAPAATVLSVIDRYRNRGLQTPIDLDVLQRAGVGGSLAPRTLQTMKQLDLVSEEGEPLEYLETLARVPQPEFQDKLAEIIRVVYADVFQYVDPTQDSTDDIRDAFRGYTPRGQQGRMVTLFTGLCAAAGLIDEEPPKTRSRKASSDGRSSSRSRSSKGSSRGKGKTHTDPATEGIPKTVLGILAGLPEPGGTWTTARRGLFMSAFKSILDLEYRIDDPPEDDGNASDN